MPWRGAEYPGEFPSLGHALIDYWEAALRVPAGPLYGRKIVLTDDQATFWIRFYALDRHGARVYRRGCRMGPKGKGKSPEGAMYVIGEFDGPVVFDGWDPAGNPVGRPRDYPIVQVAAVSEEQDHNLYGPMREMLAESDMNADNGGYIDLGKTRVEFKDGRPGRIEPVSSSHGAREGQQVTAAALEETGLWFPGKGGPKLAATLRRNASKTNGSTCEFTNPPALGEGSVAEATMDAADKEAPGLLFDCAQGEFVEDVKNPANRKAVVASMRQAYDDGKGKPVKWVDIDRLYADVLDPDTTESDAYRFFLGIARKAENRAFDPAEFDALAEPGTVPTDEPLVLAYDGARTRDCAVFSAWTIGETPKHFHVAHWSRPWNATAGYQHPRNEYKSAAREFIASHNVVLFAYDSSFHELDSLYDDWLDEFGEFDGKGAGLMVEFPTASGQRMQKAILQILEDTREGLYRHDGHEVITAHVHATVLSKNRGGWAMFAKEKDSLKIDGAVTMTFGYDLIPMARQAAGAGAGSVVFAFT